MTQHQEKRRTSDRGLRCTPVALQSGGCAIAYFRTRRRREGAGLNERVANTLRCDQRGTDASHVALCIEVAIIRETLKGELCCAEHSAQRAPYAVMRRVSPLSVLDEKNTVRTR